MSFVSFRGSMQGTRKAEGAPMDPRHNTITSPAGPFMPEAAVTEGAAYQLVEVSPNPGRGAYNRCGEIKLLAEHRLGSELAMAVDHSGGRPQKNPDTMSGFPAPVTLSDIGITWKQSSRYQQLASIPERDLRAHIASMIGMGYYSRQRHELLLIAAKGSPGTPLAKDRPDSVIDAPRTEHSRKPDMWPLFKAMYPNSTYLEMFSRQATEGVYSWGFQADQKTVRSTSEIATRKPRRTAGSG
jgi:hypothetical protein